MTDERLSEYEIKYIKDFIRRENFFKDVLCAFCVASGLLLVFLIGVMVGGFDILSVIGIVVAVIGILFFIYFCVTDCKSLDAIKQGNYQVRTGIVSDKNKEIIKMSHNSFRTGYYVRCNNKRKPIYLLEGKRAYNRLQVGDPVKIVEFSYMKKLIQLVI